MERLKIENFLCIKEADLEIRRINVIIGPQATGKSVIAKLVYFFRKIFSNIFLDAIFEEGDQNDVKQNCKQKFMEIFPEETWEKSFHIQYFANSYFIEINCTDSSLSINFTELLADIFAKMQNIYKKEIQHDKHVLDSEKYDIVNIEIMLKIKTRSVLTQVFKDSGVSNLNNSAIFIPASRSFFASLSKNVFSLLANDINIDPLMEEFGSAYELHKKIISRRNLFLKKETSASKHIDALMNSILSGEYIQKEGKEFIINEYNNNYVELAYASSGQQEALPMLLMLIAAPLSRRDKSYTYFIEEPEAHLYPKAQKQVISIFATIYNAFNQNIFLTTHSPYILTALNNLIVAKTAYDASKNPERVKALAPELEFIDFDDVAAYTIENGTLKSILDTEHRIIGPSVIDSVSDEFDQTLNGLLEVLYGE